MTQDEHLLAIQRSVAQLEANFGNLAKIYDKMSDTLGNDFVRKETLKAAADRVERLEGRVEEIERRGRSQLFAFLLAVGVAVVNLVLKLAQEAGK